MTNLDSYLNEWKNYSLAASSLARSLPLPYDGLMMPAMEQAVERALENAGCSDDSK